MALWAQGRPATAEEMKRRDLEVFADGRGLPVGKGSAVRGQGIYKAQCAMCHNDRGEGREKQYPALEGGMGSLAMAQLKDGKMAADGAVTFA